MQFKPMTDQECRQAQSNTFEPGRYRGTVVEAESKVSKRGNPMLEVQCEFNVDGRGRKVRDWIMLEGQMAWRLKEFCAACGLLERYATGEIPDHEFAGRAIEADIVIEEGEGDYPDRNRVGRYLAGAPQSFTGKAQHAPSKPMDRDPEDIPEDDIPF